MDILFDQEPLSMRKWKDIDRSRETLLRQSEIVLQSLSASTNDLVCQISTSGQPFIFGMQESRDTQS